MENSKVFKVWNSDHSEGRMLAACKFQELKNKVIAKFELGEENTCRLVLRDGCIIDDEDVFQALDSNELFVLKEGEVLQIPQLGQSSSSPSAGPEAGMPSSKSEQLTELVKRLRSKQTNKRPSKKQKSMFHKVQLGWMLYTGTKFTQVRTSNGGGTRMVEMADASTYSDLLKKAIESFFPNGSNVKGEEEEFDHHLGDFQGRSIPEGGFTLQMYISSMKACNMTIKPRIYLLSKVKDDENEDESLEISEEIVDVDFPETQPALNPVTPTPNPINPTVSTLNPGVSTPNPLSPAIPTLKSGVSTPNPQIPAISTLNPVNPTVSTLNPGVSTPIPQSPAIPTLNPVAIVTPNTPQQQESIQNEEENSWDLPDLHEIQSPVVLRMPQIPTCPICTDRFCDTFFVPCGHIACTVCTAELEERGSQCHICREIFTSTSKLFY